MGKKQDGKHNSNYRHGMVYSKEYEAWSSMVKRCTNPKSERYPRYGGRGITVCEKWRSFIGFFEDMGKMPTPRHQIDRRDNDGNYNKENCKWSTPEEQRLNRSDSRLLTFNGQTHPAFIWAKIVGIPSNVIRPRIDKSGWSVEKALTTPIQRNKKD